MMAFSSINSCSKNVFRVTKLVYGQMGSNVCAVKPSATCLQFYCGNPRTMYLNSSASCLSSSEPPKSYQGCCSISGLAKKGRILRSITINGLGGGVTAPHKRKLTISLASKKTTLKLLLPTQGKQTKVECNLGTSSMSRSSKSTGMMFGLLVCYSAFEPVHAEAANDKLNDGNDCDSPHVKLSHGKKVYTDYSITGIPGDGRCLFRSVVHGACLRLGKPAPNESLQRELADELRAKVADEFVTRREESEWFVEGDFDTYVAKMRKPHVWGGEPELFMASHVLKMPITVYMYDKEAGGLISIAEYGEEYGGGGKVGNPIRVLYHGFGHYDALQIPSAARGGAKSKL